MEEKTKAKLAAATKIALGVGRVTSGCIMATGHGLVGAHLRKHHMLQLAIKKGSEGVQAGMKMVTDGLDDWKKLT